MKLYSLLMLIYFVATGYVVSVPFWHWLGLGLILLAIIHYDFKSLRIPNLMNVALAGLGLFISLKADRSFFDIMISVVVMTVILGGMMLLYQRLRGQSGLGMGDVKFVIAAGFWIEISAMPIFMLLSSSMALLYYTVVSKGELGKIKHQHVPFGPFLCFGLWTTYFYQQTLFHLLQF